jgi:hypothetical protein
MAVQMPLGIWSLAQTPAPASHSILGADLVGLSMLVGALLVAVILMHHLAMLAWDAPRPGAVRRSVALLLVLVWLMTGALHRINHAMRPAPSASRTACFGCMPHEISAACRMRHGRS